MWKIQLVAIVMTCLYLFMGNSFKMSRTSAPPLFSPKVFFSTINNNNNNVKNYVQTEKFETISNIILYDGVCNFCNKWVDLLLRLDGKKQFSFSALQSDSGKQLLNRIGKESNDISSVVYIKKLSADPKQKNEVYFKSDAALKVMESLGTLPRVGSSFLSLLPLSLRDPVYDGVAFNRYNILGKREECRCSDKSSPERFL